MQESPWNHYPVTPGPWLSCKYFARIDIDASKIKIPIGHCIVGIQHHLFPVIVFRAHIQLHHISKTIIIYIGNVQPIAL
jgi:hypothetical protein